MALRILLMPALTCDRELYTPLREAFARLAADNAAPSVSADVKAAARELADAEYSAVLYGDATRGEALAAYAARQVQQQHADPDSGSCEFDLVMGTSFGGMCAQAALHSGVLHTPALVLISTCFSGNDLQPWLLFFRRGFALLAYLPRWSRRLLVHFVAWLFPIVRSRIAQPERVRAMIRRTNLSYPFESGRMIVEWRAGDPVDHPPRSLPAATFFIHGQRDPVIAYERVAAKRPPDFAPADGDHVMIMTRADELAAQIANWWSARKS